jgi:hypothetical protein
LVLEWNKPLGRITLGWKDVIKTDLKENDGKTWTGFTYENGD